MSGSKLLAYTVQTPKGVQSFMWIPKTRAERDRTCVTCAESAWVCPRPYCPQKERA